MSMSKNDEECHMMPASPSPEFRTPALFGFSQHGASVTPEDAIQSRLKSLQNFLHLGDLGRPGGQRMASTYFQVLGPRYFRSLRFEKCISLTRSYK